MTNKDPQNIMPRADYETTVESVETLAQVMDSQFIIPGTSIRLGLDTMIGLIPGIGDAIGLGVSSYIVMRGVQIGVPKHKQSKMVFNIILDALIGTVPIIGDLFDMGWKANNRNAQIIRDHFEKHLRADLKPPESNHPYNSIL